MKKFVIILIFIAISVFLGLYILDYLSRKEWTDTVLMILAIAAPVILIPAMIWERCREIKLHKKGVKTEGTVLKISYIYGRINLLSDWEIPVSIEFRTTDGKLIRGAPKNYVVYYGGVGGKINIYYNPKKPKEFFVENRELINN